MRKTTIQLFVMAQCQICPQMEHIFQDMAQNGDIDTLKIIDVGESPEIARKHNIRSVPYYLINDVAFYGLRTKQEILSLLHQEDLDKYKEFINSELTEGHLDSVENTIVNHSVALHAMIDLLKSNETALVVRIGLSAIIESLSETAVLENYIPEFNELLEHEDDRIAIDGLYYLSLIGTQSCIHILTEIADNTQHKLHTHAAEILLDIDT